jgi:transcriptional regulator
MYIPTAFAESDLTRLHNFIDQNSFGLLVSQVDGETFASHIPFLLDRSAGSHGCLIGHLARANPQWKEADGQKILSIFAGPHVYISPSWYESENVVPTWNFTAVHVYGRAQVIHDPDGMTQIVQAMTTAFEQGMPRPWSFDSSSKFAERMLAQIVGIRIPIDKIEGKLKLSQNHPVERQAKVIEALKAQDNENARAIAAMMQANILSKR